MQPRDPAPTREPKPGRQGALARGATGVAVVVAVAAIGLRRRPLRDRRPLRRAPTTYVRGNIPPDHAAGHRGTVPAINADDGLTSRLGRRWSAHPADAQVAGARPIGAARAERARAAHDDRQQRDALRARSAAATQPRPAHAERRAARSGRSWPAASRVRDGAVGKEEFNHAAAQLAAMKSARLPPPNRPRWHRAARGEL